MQYLTVESWAGRPAGHQRFYLSSEEVTIGRDPRNDIVIDDDAISPRHARILRTAGEWLLIDDGSTGGVWIDGRAYSTVALVHGSRFRVGATTLQFHDARTQKVVQRRADELRAELSQDVASDGVAQHAAPEGPGPPVASEAGRRSRSGPSSGGSRRPVPRAPLEINFWSVLGAVAFLALVAGAVASIWEPLLLERIIDWTLGLPGP